MDQTKMSALLGRPLTSVESINFALYLNIAKENLDGLLCMTLCDPDDTRVYDAREGYSTVFTDVFTDVSEVKVNGKVVDNYSKRQWSKRSAEWYNSLVFDKLFCDDDVVEVKGSWGFNKMPADLLSVLAGLFGQISSKNKLNPNVQSKQNREYRITFNTDVDLDEEFSKQYGKTISKYSICSIGNVKHGEVC